MTVGVGAGPRFPRPGELQARGGKGCTVVAIAVVALAGAGVAAAVLLGSSSSFFASWNGKEPLTCSGNDWIVADHVQAKFSKGIAIEASGNCNVTCKDCKLSAPTVIKARENAHIHLDHGSADGDVFSEVDDNADVSIDHTKTTGATHDSVPESKPGPQPWPSSGPYVCGRSGGGGEYDDVKVKVSKGAAIIASVNCHIKLKHCTIEGPVGMVLSDNADVELDDCEVHATDGLVARANGSVILEGGTFVGSDHAVLLEDNANVRAHGSHIEGKKSFSGNATILVE